MTARSLGFTLLELLIAVSIFIFLVMLAGPMYAQFMANSQIRNAGEAMLNGVQRAQATAVSGNAQTRLLVNGATGWQILETIEGAEPSPPNPIQVYAKSDGAPNATVTLTPADATQITFDGFGRIVPNADASPTIACIDVAHSLSGTRNLRVVISNNVIGVGTKLCDPDAAIVAPDPMACPANPCA